MNPFLFIFVVTNEKNMKTNLILLFLLISASCFSQAQFRTTSYDKQLLYEELNYARANQKLYGKQHKLKLKNRSTIPFQKSKLLEEKAQKWADFMASGKDARFYRHSGRPGESIGWNYGEPHNLIFDLIEDEGVKSLGHRKHMFNYNHKDTHVGIGLSTNDSGRWFICVLTSSS